LKARIDGVLVEAGATEDHHEIGLGRSYIGMRNEELGGGKTWMLEEEAGFYDSQAVLRAFRFTLTYSVSVTASGF
jgi:hypothetical protein